MGRLFDTRTAVAGHQVRATGHRLAATKRVGPATPPVCTCISATARRATTKVTPTRPPTRPPLHPHRGHRGGEEASTAAAAYVCVYGGRGAGARCMRVTVASQYTGGGRGRLPSSSINTAPESQRRDVCGVLAAHLAASLVVGRRCGCGCGVECLRHPAPCSCDMARRWRRRERVRARSPPWPGAPTTASLRL